MHDLVLGGGGYLATFSLLDGALRKLTFHGRPMVETFPAGERAPMSANLHLAPWPNRVRPFSYAGIDVIPPIDIHGIAQLCRWEPLNDGIRTTFGPEQGWPWRMEIVCTVAFGSGVRLSITARNLSDTTAPYAYGMHPYVTAGGAPLDECTISAPMFGEFDLAGRTFDDCFAWKDSNRIVRLTNSAGEGVEIRTSSDLKYLQLFTADPVFSDPYPFSAHSSGRALAMEPMTARAYAMNTGEDIVHLEPGAEYQSVIYFRWITPNLR